MANISVGFPLVGTGQKKALRCSSVSLVLWSARLLTLPAFMLLRLLLLFRLPLLRSDCFFLRVLPLEREIWWPLAPSLAMTSDRWEAEEVERCILLLLLLEP